MLKTKSYLPASRQFLSFTNIPAIREHNFKIVHKKAIHVAVTRNSRAAPQSTKHPDPVRSAKSVLAWNIIYAEKVASGWKPKKPSKRFKAFQHYQKAKAAASKAEIALNRSKANQGSPIECAYLVAQSLKGAVKPDNAGQMPKRKSR